MMQNKLVLGIFSHQSVNAALDNLAEADYKNISVIALDIAIARQLADDIGPLRGINYMQLPHALKQQGVPSKTITSIQKALQEGSVCIAFTTPTTSVDPAIKILQGAGALAVESI